MSYINKIDLLIYNSINEIYNDIKDEKFKKLDSFGKEPEYEKIIHKYIKNNKSKNELKDVLKDKSQIQQVEKGTTTCKMNVKEIASGNYLVKITDGKTLNYIQKVQKK